MTGLVSMIPIRQNFDSQEMKKIETSNFCSFNIKVNESSKSILGLETLLCTPQLSYIRKSKKGKVTVLNSK